jgi:hypothetical protein
MDFVVVNMFVSGLALPNEDERSCTAMPSVLVAVAKILSILVAATAPLE